MSQEEKLEHGAARKDVGAELFKSKRYRLALQCYKRVADLFGYIDNYKEENKAKEGQSLSQHILWLMFHLKGEEPDSDLGARGKRCFLSPFLSLFVLGRGDEDGLHSEPGGVRVEVGALRRGQAELRYRAEASGQSRESALPPCSGLVRVLPSLVFSHVFSCLFSITFSALSLSFKTISRNPNA